MDGSSQTNPSEPTVFQNGDGWYVQIPDGMVGPLRSAEARLEGDELTLLVPPDFVAFAESHREDYQRGARAAFDRAITVKIERGVAREPAAAAAGDQKQERLRRAAEKEPAVREALDLFGGKLVDVREEGN